MVDGIKATVETPLLFPFSVQVRLKETHTALIKKESMLLLGVDTSWNQRSRKKIIIEALLSDAVWTRGWVTNQQSW